MIAFVSRVSLLIKYIGLVVCRLTKLTEDIELTIIYQCSAFPSPVLILFLVLYCCPALFSDACSCPSLSIFSVYPSSVSTLLVCVFHDSLHQLQTPQAVCPCHKNKQISLPLFFRHIRQQVMSKFIFHKVVKSAWNDLKHLKITK